MDKLVFTLPRPAREKSENTIMRLTPAAYNAVEEISAKTGLSNCYIASQMILFAAGHTEVEFGFSETAGGGGDG